VTVDAGRRFEGPQPAPAKGWVRRSRHSCCRSLTTKPRPGYSTGGGSRPGLCPPQRPLPPIRRATATRQVRGACRRCTVHRPTRTSRMGGSYQAATAEATARRRAEARSRRRALSQRSRDSRCVRAGQSPR
jgi:hypothetical protein